MKETNNKPPATNPFKKRYMLQDLKILSSMFDLPSTLQVPKDFPPKTITIQRFLTAIKLYGPTDLRARQELLEKSSLALWKFLWLDRQPIESLDSVKTHLEKYVSKDVCKYFDLVEDAQVKDALTNWTKEAVHKHGMFGAPWIVVEKSGQEPISLWGSDRLESLASVLDKPYLGANPLSRSSKL